MKLIVEMKPEGEILKQLGLAPGGAAQKYWTQRVAAHMQKYLPFRAVNSFGNAVNAGIAQDGTFIEIKLPFARFLYYGKLMIGEKSHSAYAKSNEKKILAVPEKDLVYTKTYHAQAGPYWDRRIKQNDMPQLTEEMKLFLRGRNHG